MRHTKSKLNSTRPTLIAALAILGTVVMSSGCATSQRMASPYEPNQVQLRINPSRTDCPNVGVANETTGQSEPAKCITFLEQDAVALIAELVAACTAITGEASVCTPKAAPQAR